MSTLRKKTEKKYISKTQATAYRISVASVFAALSLIFSYIEAMIPFQPAIPGIKLGIANLVVLLALYVLNGRYAFGINMIRILIAGPLFSGLFGVLYSLAGGILSFFVMLLLKKTGWFSPIGVSMAGGVAHNSGQLFTAALIVSDFRLFFYFPVLLFSGLLCGIFIGILTALILKRLPDRLSAIR